MSPIADSAFFSPLTRETRFVIVRHGESEGNAKRIFQGRLDLPLGPRGRAQARGLGAWLAGEGVEAILSSPLARATETAQIAARACARAEIRADPLFAEIDTGIFTGLSYEEAAERHPAIFAAFEGRSWEAVPGAERAEALYDRAMLAWEALRDLAASESAAKGGATGRRLIACVSHGGFIQWLVRATFGSRSWMPLFSTANCGVFELLVAPRREGAFYLQWKLLNFVPPTIP